MGGTLEACKFLISALFKEYVERCRGEVTTAKKVTLKDFAHELQNYQFIKTSELNELAERMFGMERGQRVIFQAKHSGMLLNKGRGLFKVMWR
ncbi:hypothetical protein SS50377_20410 [Spironucleus salmonicida]|uniref:Uncharacterized protein n=1 Tax=Spironucleus salmonicida TaxID=348837 RepID=V6M4F6_9EUKA|nr:hypothetical protein SS50377_20405 [Spironucleus salmonicida]KAH0577062.1 hypothetical protein SS50377_20410 [Spironucleus salmonicida]|eukprot:EST48199.1 Hypothetical protein SS50377_11637 [Spironucleus salmonicida]